MNVLRCQHLSVEKKGRPLLTGISCALPEGQLTAIVGPNGAGKSTLLRAFAGLEEAAAARVWAGDRSLGEMRPQERARLLAWSPESQQIPFAFTVTEVVMMGGFPWHRGRPTAPERGWVEQLLAFCGLAAKRQSPLHELSSGELRKVMLARAVCQRTPILLLDEPCANLDLAASLEVLDFLKQLTGRGITVAACLHDIMLVKRFADHVVVLKEGRQVASGPCPEVLNRETIQAVFQVKVQFVASPWGELMSVQSQEKVKDLAPYF